MQTLEKLITHCQIPDTFFITCNWQSGITKDFAERDCCDDIVIQIKCEWYGHSGLLFFLLEQRYLHRMHRHRCVCRIYRHGMSMTALHCLFTKQPLIWPSGSWHTSCWIGFCLCTPLTDSAASDLLLLQLHLWITGSKSNGWTVSSCSCFTWSPYPTKLSSTLH